MEGVVDAARKKVNSKCVKQAMRESGCSVSLKDVPRKRLIVGCNCPSLFKPDETHCDYLFFADVPGRESCVTPVELKRGGVRPSEVIAQLQAGARAAEKIIPQNSKIHFLPVLASGELSKKQRLELRKSRNKIRFRNTSVLVSRIRCGAPLVEAIGKACAMKSRWQ